MAESETFWSLIENIKNELLPGLASPSYGLDETATMMIDHKTGSLVILDRHEVGFVFTRREMESGDYKFLFNPRMLDWRARRLERGKRGARGTQDVSRET